MTLKAQRPPASTKNEKRANDLEKKYGIKLNMSAIKDRARAQTERLQQEKEKTEKQINQAMSTALRSKMQEYSSLSPKKEAQ